MKRLPCLLCCLLSSALGAAPAHDTSLPGPTVPEGLGVNIHFTDPRPGEMEMLAAAGFRWVRMDLSWSRTEPAPGQYDFSSYDRLMASLEAHGIRALLILDYANKHYDQGLSPCSDEGRAAFARWAAAAVGRFRARGILWEMYNEPNIRFWKPEPNVENYVKLALAVGRAIRAVAPEEMYIGPATSRIDMKFLESCFRGGLLEHWCAVSVHPYRQQGPETAAAEYAALRRLIDRYAPTGKRIPILSGEWGYSAAWKTFDPQRQGKMLPRQWLVNLANDVPVSIWYDWHDDGRDPAEPEHHFGTVLNPYYAGRDPVYDPKPAYLAAKTLTRLLEGFRYNKRLAVGTAEEHVLLFTRGADVRLAAWTTAAEPREIALPASPGRFALTAHTGERLAPHTAGARGLQLVLGDAPQYLVPEGANELLRLAAAWERLPAEICEPAGEVTLRLGLTNPLARPIRVLSPHGAASQLAPGERTILSQRVTLLREAAPSAVEARLAVEGLAPLEQRARAVARNPLSLEFGPFAGKAMAVSIENPSGEPFQGVLLLTEFAGMAAREQTPLALAAGTTRAVLRIPLDRPAEDRFRFGARLVDAQGRLQLTVPAQTYRPVARFDRLTAETLAEGYRLLADGDRKVASRQAVALAAPPAGLPLDVGQCLKITYDIDAGWKYIQLRPGGPQRPAIDGRPKALVLWLHNDGHAVGPRLRLVDASGQTFQFSAERLRGEGWRRLVIPTSGDEFGHWGGANDGVVHEPLRWDSLLLLDKPQRDEPCRGEVYVAEPMLVY